MDKLIKELIQIEKKRNSLLAEINNSLKEIANRENSDIKEKDNQNGYYDCPI